MRFQGFETTVTGDVGSHAVWAEIHAAHPTRAVLGAGFPCQPWSRLGDQKKSTDVRALTLKSVLRCSFFLRCHTILLECVTEARKDKDGLKQLTEWCLITKYNARDIILDLNQIWCTNRKHWWCLLTFPGSSPPALEPFPNLPALVTVGDVLPDFPIWPPDHQHQLDIGTVRVSKVLCCKTFHKNTISCNSLFCIYGVSRAPSRQRARPAAEAANKIANCWW